ncbi:hypothetical protein [Burkholderia stagnalis]|uniref:hypothetical protein n=1 Tax=Burkholderia stagnalis TaxID=1503054 RepID=UPI0012DA86A0|nr:hypothetical protein [Burkholderia stagnalis]
MKKVSVKGIIVFLMWIISAIWVISRTPTGPLAKERLGVVVKDLDYLFKNSIIFSRHENAKSGSAIALYGVDLSTFDDEKVQILKGSLKGRGWVFVGENDRAYVMCKSGMKLSISKVTENEAVSGPQRRAFSVSMEFNAGTEDFCRRRMR